MTANISVVIPTYNRLELLKEAIESVRRQRSSVSEIIVVDDGSSDQTASWCRMQPDIAFYSTNRRGPSGARNVGAAKANGNWIAFLDSDDAWFDNHIQRAKDIIASETNCRFIICNFILTDKDLVQKRGIQGFPAAFPAFRSSERLFSILFPQKTKSDVWHGLAKRQALLGNWLQPSGLLIERQLFLQAGGFNERLWRSEDMDLLLRLVNLAPATLCRTPSYAWRQGQSDSLAADAFALELKMAGLRVLSRRGLEIVRSEPRYLMLLCFSLATMACDLVLAALLRKIRKFESMPQMQTLVQTGISLLNVAVPIAMAHLYPRADFANYRIFSMWLSATSALSFTSGFWSLIPFWSVQGGGAAKIKLAWRLQCSSGLFIAANLFVLSSTMFEASERTLGIYLSISSAALLPAIFLEQRLCFLQRGLLSSTLVALFEILRSGSMLILVWIGYSLDIAIAMVPIFLFLRGMALYLVNNRIQRTSDSDFKIWQIKSVLSESLPIGLAAALSTLSAIFDRMYLSRNLSPDAFSIIAAGTISLPIIMFLEQTLVQKTLPTIAPLLQGKMHKQCSNSLKNVIEILMKNSIPFTFFLVLFAPEILHVLFSGRYQDAVPAFRLFAFTNILSCVPQDIISRAMGRSQRILAFAAASAALSALSVATAFNLYGVYPAIMAGLLANFFVRVLFLYADLRQLKIALSRILPSLETALRSIRAAAILLATKVAATQSNMSPVTTLLISSICLLLIIKAANKSKGVEAYPSGGKTV